MLRRRNERLREHLRRLLREHPERMAWLDMTERAVVEGRLEGATLRAIAATTRLSHEGVRRVQDRALAKLMGAGEEDG